MTDTTSAGTVVVLGGRSEREFTVLRDLGYRVVLLDEQVPWHCMPWVDVPIDVDVNDWAAVAEAIRNDLGDTPPAAVLTHTEPRLPLMAHLTQSLCSTPKGLSEEAALNCRDKWRTRTALTQAGLPVPQFALVADADEAVAAAHGIGFPVIVKPRDGAGAFGVRRCTSDAEVIGAVNALLEAPPGTMSGALVEEYIDGPEFAVQTITHDADTRVLSVFRQRMTEPPVFVELGYDHPSGLSESDLGELEQLMQRALPALGVRDWVSHTQIRRDARGFRIIEVNARRPGGRLVEMTTAISGVDMTEAVTRLALGLPPAEPGTALPFARYSSITFDTAGTVLYNEWAPVPGPKAPIVEIEVAPGEPVLPKDHPEGGVYGRIVVFGDSPEELDRAERSIRETLSLQVVGNHGLDWVGVDSREYKSCC
ncbi:acetyl-CoA carboxylase biotin carboxylase subunit family protein [Streptomyces sp. NBC_00154]|uniref:ATP-grasp domain-containing protein n=1 Tax=Streptomyces sp. NBC_00154 TaxID=2975670 RepID=UPI00224E7DDA|nr:ATP-grasp domain-containing protein [Streptomyces sp. NBC_00154]MCX5316129.1 ATP-grasp domain-containing protein [Streptomyces sp. NBC_00154]